MLSGRDIICISSIDWDAHWQIHHQIASSLVAAGNRVLFVENTGVRAPGVRDFSRMRQRVANWWRSTKGFREVSPGLYVYSPLFAPFPYSSIARWFNRTVMFRGLMRWMDAASFRRPVVWTFLPTPTAQDLIAAVDPSAVVYYCADDFAATSPGARRVSQSETVMFRRADLVFVTSERLRQKAAQVSSAVHAFPAGVDFGKFEAVRQSANSLPADLATLPRPVAGYIGALHLWLDQDLMARVSEQLPDVTFAFVGPEQVDVTRLTSRPNVRLFGARPHDQVPAYVKGFDVALVPYLRSDFTDSVYPVKLNEYLAMGVPVVATDLPEIRRFNERHGDVLEVAGTADEFVDRVRLAVNDRHPDRASRRVAVARENSWSARLRRCPRCSNRRFARGRGTSADGNIAFAGSTRGRSAGRSRSWYRSCWSICCSSRHRSRGGSPSRSGSMPRRRRRTSSPSSPAAWVNRERRAAAIRSAPSTRWTCIVRGLRRASSFRRDSSSRSARPS